MLRPMARPEGRTIQTPGFRVSLTSYDLSEGVVFSPGAEHNHLVHVVSGPGQKIVGQARSLAFGSRPMPLGVASFLPVEMPASFRATPGELRVCHLRFTQDKVEQLIGSRVTWRFETMAPFVSLRLRAVLVAMQQLETECLKLGVAQQAYVDAVGTAIVIDLCRRFANTSEAECGAGGKLAPWQLRRIEEYARDAVCAGQASVADFAALCGVSAGHLARCFKQTTGMTVNAYAQAVRIERARGMLAESELPLKEIAAACGFSTAGYFSTAFQRAAGESPRNYRARVRAKAYRLARPTSEARSRRPLEAARAAAD
jgi:AraC family transcriptional regulator